MVKWQVAISHHALRLPGLVQAANAEPTNNRPATSFEIEVMMAAQSCTLKLLARAVVGRGWRGHRHEGDGSSPLAHPPFLSDVDVIYLFSTPHLLPLNSFPVLKKCNGTAAAL
jgi:hypothetical protein